MKGSDCYGKMEIVNLAVEIAREVIVSQRTKELVAGAKRAAGVVLITLDTSCSAKTQNLHFLRRSRQYSGLTETTTKEFYYKL